MLVDDRHLPAKGWTAIKEAKGYGLSGERLLMWDCFIEQLANNYVCPAGRRALKSVLWMRLMVYATLYFEREHAGFISCYCAPTEGQVIRIAWDRLKALIPPDRLKREWEKDLCIELYGEREIWLFGLDAPQRIEGNEYDIVAIDESADQKPETFEAHIVPLIKPDGVSIHLGVFDYRGIGQEEYESKYDKCIKNDKDQETAETISDNISGELDEKRALKESKGVDYLKASDRIDWIAFHWPSVEVMPKEKVELLAFGMSTRLFKQEILGLLTEAPGRAYGDYVSRLHDFDSLPHIKGKVIHVSCDFNFRFHNWIMVQVDFPEHLNRRSSDRIWRARIFDQVFLPDATVNKMCQELKKMLREQYGETYLTQYGLLHFYGDFSGNQQRAEATESAWQIIKGEFPNACFHIKVQPPVITRIESVNGMLLNHSGVVRVAIAKKKAPNIIRDFKFVSTKMLKEQTGKSGSLSHASDCFGYFLDQYRIEIENFAKKDFDPFALARQLNG